MRHFVYAAILGLLPTVAVAQEPTIPTPPSLTTEGIPPIPQSIADGLARYTQFRQAQMQTWHPNRRELLVRWPAGRLDLPP